MVESYGITDEQIAAAAMALRGEDMLILDRMGSNRATSIRHLRKAIERRAEAGKIPGVQRGDQGLGAQGLAN
jgi:hypothetical protein